MTFINFAGAILFWFLAYFCLLANEPLQSYNSAYQTICESVQQFWRRPTSWYRSFGFRTSRLQQPHRCTFDLAQAIGAARSQVRGQRLLLVTFSIFVLIFLLIQSTTPAVVRGEGFIISMDGEGAILELASLVAKEHGEGPKTVLGPSSYAKPTVKRSYRRAVRRAMQCGYTWYKGRLFTTSSRSASVCPPSESHVTASTPTVQPSKRHQRQRMLCLTWNSGGLAQATWDMFQQWADKQEVDFITIQETHWQFTSEWTQSNYHCIHSGYSNRQAGILCMVSKRLCQAHHLSWTEVDPGRLLHLRVHGESRSIDFLTVYQHVFSNDRLEQRQTFLDQLNNVLSRIPQRNMLVLLGDFNTSLLTKSKVVGSGQFVHNGRRQSGTQHTDSSELHDLLRQHSLLALNTWMVDNTATFVNGAVALQVGLHLLQTSSC